MGFFDTKQKTVTDSSSTQSSSGQSQNQSNIWPQLQPYFQNYTGYQMPGPFNPNQVNAAARQDALPGNLNPAFAAAGAASTGATFNPTSYAPYMSPYTQQVVDATRGMQEYAKSADLERLTGGMGKNFSLGNNVGTKAAYLAGRAPADTAAISALYDRGFTTANDNAYRAGQQQLQGAQTTGALTGAATTANQSGFNIGQTLWQNPLQWQTQWNQGLYPYLQGAGNNTTSSSTGTSTGHSVGTTTSSPSMWQIATGIAGMFLKDGGRVGYAEGGRIKPYHAGGGSDFPSKVASAFKSIKAMREGGEVKGYDWGGTVTPYNGGPDSADPYWDGVKATAEQNQTLQPFKDFARKAAGTSIGPSEVQGDPNGKAMDALSRQQQGLTQFMQSSQPRGFDEGGAVTPATAGGWSPPAWLKGIGGPDSIAGSLLRGQRYDGMRASDLSRGLMATSGPLVMGNFADTLKTINQERIAQEHAKQMWSQLSGQLPDGSPTLAGRAQPSELAEREARTKLYGVQADKQWLLELEKQKMEYAKALELAKMQAQAEGVSDIVRKLDAARDVVNNPNQRYIWRKVTNPAQTPIPSEPPAAAAPAVTPPATAPTPAPAAPGNGAGYTPGSPAALSYERRAEAQAKMQAAQAAQADAAKTYQAQTQQGFDSEHASLDPYEFVRKYDNLRSALKPEQIMELDKRIDLLSRSKP